MDAFCVKILFVLTLASCLKHISAWYYQSDGPSYRYNVPYHGQPRYTFPLPYPIDTSAKEVKDISCPTGQVKCSSGGKCATVCNGKSECLYQEDENACEDLCEIIPQCMKGQMFCPETKTCVGICDGKKECASGIDEKNCRKKCQYLEMLCPDGKKCAKPCDGYPECPGGEDESNCPAFDKCNSQYITECLCRISLLSYSSFDSCSEIISNDVLVCVEGRRAVIAELNLEPEQVCSSRSDMLACLCLTLPGDCDQLEGPIAACIG